MENNIFTPKIVDLILPGCSIESKGGEQYDSKTNASKSTNFASGSSMTLTTSNVLKGDTDSGSELIINLNTFNHLFLVMELGELDFKTLFDTVP